MTLAGDRINAVRVRAALEKNGAAFKVSKRLEGELSALGRAINDIARPPVEAIKAGGVNEAPR